MNYQKRLSEFLGRYPEAAPAAHIVEGPYGTENMGVKWANPYKLGLDACQACGSKAVRSLYGVNTSEGLKWVGQNCLDAIRHKEGHEDGAY